MKKNFFPGSVYVDRVLISEGFVGESVRSGSVLVYKAHGSRLSPEVSRTCSII